MITFKNDLKNPSSNFETGIKKNFNNIFFKFFTLIAFILTGLHAGFNGIAGFNVWSSLGIWYGVWFLVFLFTIIPIKDKIKFLDQREMPNLFDAANDSGDEAGCLLTVLSVLFFPFVYPLFFIFDSKYKNLRNRFFYYQNKKFIVLDEKKEEILEIESYNLFFNLWIMLFRKADLFDAHVKMFEKSIEKANNEESELLDINKFKTDLEDFLRLEVVDLDDHYSNTDNFIDYMKSQNPTRFTKSMENYARELHKKRLEELRR